jgi:hypothetical protein
MRNPKWIYAIEESHVRNSGHGTRSDALTAMIKYDISCVFIDVTGGGCISCVSPVRTYELVLDVSDQL